MAVEYVGFISTDAQKPPLLASIVMDAMTCNCTSKASEAQIIGFFCEIDAALKRHIT